MVLTNKTVNQNQYWAVVKKFVRFVQSLATFERSVRVIREIREISVRYSTQEDVKLHLITQDVPYHTPFIPQMTYF